MRGLSTSPTAFRLVLLHAAWLAFLGPSPAEAQSYAIQQQAFTFGKRTLSGGAFALTARIDPAVRSQTLAGGGFSLKGDWSSLAEPFGAGMLPLVSPNHAPVPGNVTVQVQPYRVLKVQLSRLLSAARDPDGDPLQVQLPNTSVNGASVSVQGTWLIYDPAGMYRLPDIIEYTVTDGYDTTSGSLAIEVAPGTDDPSQNRVNLRLDGDDVLVDFMGIPGRNYIIQSTSELGTAWENVAWLTSDRFGRIQYVDVGGASAPTRYFRTVAP